MADNFRPTKKQRETMRRRFDEAKDELDRLNDFDSRIPKDVVESGTQMETAPTRIPSRPRAKSIGYNSNSKTLYIIFRDNKWWEYRNVPVRYWIGLQNSNSTGDYLRTVGNPPLDQWPDMGPANLDNMSTEAKTRLNENALNSDRIQAEIDFTKNKTKKVEAKPIPEQFKTQGFKGLFD